MSRLDSYSRFDDSEEEFPKDEQIDRLQDELASNLEEIKATVKFCAANIVRHADVDDLDYLFRMLCADDAANDMVIDALRSAIKVRFPDWRE